LGDYVTFGVHRALKFTGIRNGMNLAATQIFSLFPEISSTTGRNSRNINYKDRSLPGNLESCHGTTMVIASSSSPSDNLFSDHIQKNPSRGLFSCTPTKKLFLVMCKFDLFQFTA
jgi:hypothetical protein